MNRIAEIRAEGNLSQAQLCSKLGWSQGRISNYESGARTPGLEDSRRIVEALNALGATCTLDDAFPPTELNQEAA